MKVTRRFRLLARPLLVLALGVTSTAAIYARASGGTATPFKQLQSELQAGIQTKALPANITPPTSTWDNLWQTDYGDVPTGGGNSKCWNFTQGSSALPTCVYGDHSATRTLVLTGDSQAWMWEPSFNRWGLANKWKVIVLTKSGCQPWPDAQQEYVDSSPFPACRVFQSSVWKYVNRTRPSVVVAAGLVPVTPTTSISRVKSDIASFVSEIAPSKAKVLLVDPSVSFYAYDYTEHSTLTAPTCLSLHPDQIQACDGISKSLLLNYYMNAVLNSGPLPGGSQLLDLSQLLCTTKCPMIADGTLVYIDGDHVTYDWALRASSALGEILAPYVKS